MALHSCTLLHCHTISVLSLTTCSILSQTAVFLALDIVTWVAAGLPTGLHDLPGSGFPALWLCDALLVPTYHQRFLDSWHHHHQFVPGRSAHYLPTAACNFTRAFIHTPNHPGSSLTFSITPPKRCGQAQVWGCCLLSTYVGCRLLVPLELLEHTNFNAC